MKKSDVYNFVLRVQRKAVNSVDKKYDELIKKEEDKIQKKYKSELDEFGLAILQLQQSFDKLRDKIDRNIDYNVRERHHAWSNDLSKLVFEISRKKPNDIFKDNTVVRGDRLTQLRKEQSQAINDVSNEYGKVYSKCKSLGSAKQCVDYLKELGFDTSSIEVAKVEDNAKKDIDTNKLFVCGENK